MDEGTKAYTQNKIISLGWTFAAILGSLWYLGFNSVQWQFILLLLIISAYGHFLVGFWYQLRSFLKKPKPWQHYLVFGLLSFASIVVVEILYVYAGFAVTLFVGFVYFLLHGLLNEQTLIKRETDIHVPLAYIAAIMIFIFSLLAYAVPDPTFLFNRYLSFVPTDSFILTQTFLRVGLEPAFFTYVFWGGAVASFVLLSWIWFINRNRNLTLCIAASLALALVVTLIWGAPPFIYLYFVVMGYHFMTWFLYYLRNMKKRSKPALNNFLLLHAIVLTPFIVGGWWMLQDEAPAIVYTIFDYKYSTVATYIHISTSFMNDHWFQSLQGRAFQFFGQKS